MKTEYLRRAFLIMEVAWLSASAYSLRLGQIFLLKATILQRYLQVFWCTEHTNVGCISCQWLIDMKHTHQSWSLMYIKL